MTNIVSLVIKLLVIIVVFVVIIAAIYVWILPSFLQGYKTYSFLVIGAIGSAALGGYSCYKATNALTSYAARLIMSSFAGVIVAALVVALSLFIILNTRGT